MIISKQARLNTLVFRNIYLGGKLKTGVEMITMNVRMMIIFIGEGACGIWGEVGGCSWDSGIISACWSWFGM